MVTWHCEEALHRSVAVKLTTASPVSAAAGVQPNRLLAGLPLVTDVRVPGPEAVRVTRSPASASRALTVNDSACPTWACTVDPQDGAVKTGVASPGEHCTTI